MKHIPSHYRSGKGRLTSAILLLIGLAFPLTTFAQGHVKIQPAANPPDPALIIGGGLLLLAFATIVALAIRASRSNVTIRVLADELEITRNRLRDTTQTLEEAEFQVKGTEDRYQNILYEAEVGMFQIELDGACSYINAHLEKMSGLYLKKAAKEGLISAIHPEDRDRFRLEWQDFVEKDKSEFNTRFRFRKVQVRGEENDVHVACRVNKVRTDKKEVESYIGWIWDVTAFYAECRNYEHDKEQYKFFIDETVEGFYRLEPDKPILLKSKPDRLTDAILKEMRLTNCNETFASMYGSTPRALQGSQINSLAGGCGLFKNAEMVKGFVENGFKAVGVESVRQDPRGNRLTLSNSVIGQIRDGTLVAIWGSQRNISRQKREVAELRSQTQFMHRILNTMPADIHVKDTRCRYLFVSGQVAERTGIPEEEWVGKTIFEVLPGTPMDYDHDSIQAMKTGKRERGEKEYEIRGKKNWMETIQVPLVSEEGLVEGVVGFSIESTDRKQKEEKLTSRLDLVEKRLALRDDELKKEKNEHNKTSLTLQDVNRKLRVQEAEVDAKVREYEEKLKSRQSDEDLLAQEKAAILKRQKDLEEQLCERLEELNRAAEQRKELEDQIKIKDNEVRTAGSASEQRTAELAEAMKKVEAQAEERAKLLEAEIAKRDRIQQELRDTKEELDNIREEMITLIRRRDEVLSEAEELHRHQLQVATGEQQSELEKERNERKAAQTQLKKTESVLEKTQEKLKELASTFEAELRRETEARSAAEKQLNENATALGELQQQFRVRIDEETRGLKQELGSRQIREKAMRQSEKELEMKIHDLEQELQKNQSAQAEQAELRTAAEQELEILRRKVDELENGRQEQVADATEALEKTLEEVKKDDSELRRQLESLLATRKELEQKMEKREEELRHVKEDQKKLQSVLTATQNKLSQARSAQAEPVEHKEPIQQQAEQQTNELEEERIARKKLERELQQLRITYDLNRKNTTELIKESKQALQAKIQKHKEMEKDLSEAVTDLKTYSKKLQQELEVQRKKLEAERTRRTELETSVARLQGEGGESAEKDQQQAEDALKRKIAELEKKNEERKNELIATEMARKTVEFQLQEARNSTRQNSTLVDSLNDAVQTVLAPVLDTSLLSSVPEELRNRMMKAEQKSRQLVDMLHYHREMSHIADGSNPLCKGELNLHNLLLKIDQQFSELAETKHIFFALSYAQKQSVNNVPERVETDARIVQQVLNTLLEYAFGQTEKGRLGIHASRTDQSNTLVKIRFELAYTGRQEKDPQLENIFGQSDFGENNYPPGINYSLALCRQYARLLGGDICLDYRQGGVTAFTFEFACKNLSGGNVFFEEVLLNYEDEEIKRVYPQPDQHVQ